MKRLPKLASKRVETVSLGQCPGQPPTLPDVREALVLTVPDPSDYRTLITAPARDAETLDSIPAMPGCCQLLQKFQSKGFSWPQRLCTFPSAPQCLRLEDSESVGSTDGWQEGWSGSQVCSW